MKYLVLALLMGAASAFASSVAEGAGIGRYAGTYELTQDRVGICDERLRIWSSEGLDGDSFQAWVGRYFFREVNAGPRNYNNEFERGVRTSTYARGRLVSERRSYHKIKRLKERQRVEARFSGRSLRLVSRLWGDPPTEGDCTYRRIRGDDGISSEGDLGDGGSGDDNLDPRHPPRRRRR